MYRFACLCAAVSIAAACSSSDESGSPVSYDVVRSGLARDMNPQVSNEERDSLARSQARFALDLYQSVRKGHAGEDLFLSPYSISVALGMTYAGAKGNTAAEMRKALRLDLPDDRVHPAYDALDLALASRNIAPDADGKTPFRVNVANSLWGQKGVAFGQPFLDTLAVSYGAGVNAVDFAGHAEGARLAINGWVEDKTEDRIKDLLAPGAVNPNTLLVLVNAVYFNAKWASPFDHYATADAPFTKLDGSKEDVTMMRSSVTSRAYAKSDDWEAVAIDYAASPMSMVVIAPTRGRFDAVEGSLDGDTMLDIVRRLEAKRVVLSLPKVNLESTFKLRDSLVQLGMDSAFGGGADFSGMFVPSPSIGEVIHKTFLDVDEDGTEAAAATAVMMDGGIALPGHEDPPIEMKVDRPFFTAIVDRPTNTIVFFGRVLAP